MTSSNIEGVSGYTSTNSNWRVFQSGSSFTGGTVSGATNFTGGLTANTISTSGFTILTKLSTLNAVDDTAAAALGVPLYGLYRNNNAVQIRLV